MGASYSIVVSEELGNIGCGGIPMAIGVQTDMATPGLARDARLLSIGEGTDEVMLSIICKYMDTLPKAPPKK